MIQKCALFLGVSIATFFLLCIGCENPSLSHKLVATSTNQSVPLYPDEQTYLKVSHERQEGGVSGLAGNVKETMEAKTIDSNTPVDIVSSDDNGAMVVITDGPMKGTTGFVARTNID